MISEETGKIEDYISIFRIESAFQDLIQRIQKKIKKFQHLKDVMGDPNLLKIFQKRLGWRIQDEERKQSNLEGRQKLYQCRICKKTYPKSQQLGGHLRKGHPIDEGLEVGQP